MAGASWQATFAVQVTNSLTVPISIAIPPDCAPWHNYDSQEATYKITYDPTRKCLVVTITLEDSKKVCKRIDDADNSFL